MMQAKELIFLNNNRYFVTFLNTFHYEIYCWDKSPSGERKLNDDYYLIWNTGKNSKLLNVWIEKRI